MSSTKACPGMNQYQRLASGQLADIEKESLLDHLEVCDSCAQTLKSLPEPDTLVAVLRQADTVEDAVSGEALARLVDSLSKLRPSAKIQPAISEMPTQEFSSVEATPPPEPAVQHSKELCDFLAPPQSPDELGRLGPYRVLQVLGTGGMGMVFLAEDPNLDRRVALKVMLPKFAANEAAKQRFLREARTAAKLKSDHIVQIFQVGEDRGVPFLAMELLEGMPLDGYLKSGRPLTLPQILRLGGEIARGLAAAHDKGLIHRDIKPGNIWLEDRGDGRPACHDAATGEPPVTTEFRAKILDFGLARSDKDDIHLTQSGAIVGTPAYMAPEQARGERNVDARVDLFSLGCVLYRLCAGDIPFKSETTMGVLLAIAMTEPTPPTQIDQTIPPALSDLVMRLLDKDPAKRPASAKEVMKSLQTIEKETQACRLAFEESHATAVSTIPTEKSSEVAAAASHPANAKRKRGLLVGVAVVAAALMFAAAVFFLQTPHGIVRIEINDPDIEVVLSKTGAVIKGADKKHEITLAPGEHGLKIKRGDFEFDTDKFILKKGDTVALRIDWLPGKLLVTRDGQPFARKNLGSVAAAPGKLPDRVKPFVLLRKAGGQQEFQNLAGALLVLQEGDTIEVHGNGPFIVGHTTITGKSLRLRAAPGYRPVFRAGDTGGGSSWFELKKAGPMAGSLSVEGCDFDALRTHYLVFSGAAEQWEFRNCRFMGNYMLASSGGSVVFEDCLFAMSGWVHGHSWAEPGKIAMRNCIVHAGGCFTLWESSGSELQVELKGNTIRCGGTLFSDSRGNQNADAPPIAITATENVLDFHLVADVRRTKPTQQTPKDYLNWQGHKNLYVQRPDPSTFFMRVNGKAHFPGFPEWVKYWDEQGSLAPPQVLHGWDALSQPGADKLIAWLRADLERLRQEHKLPNLGPDWDLVGPGAAYVRARFPNFPAAQLRPPATKDGPFVILRDGKLVRGYPGLREALTAIQDGDILEIRSDDPFAGVPESQFPGVKGQCTFTLRAAPGYRPVQVGYTNFPANYAVTLEGLHIRGPARAWRSGVNIRVERIVNCSFEEDRPIPGAVAERNLVVGRKEIINSLIPCEIGGVNLVVRNSLVGDGGGGWISGLVDPQLERCHVWCPLETWTGGIPVKARLRDSIFDVDVLSGINAKLVAGALQNSGNLYRLGVGRWRAQAPQPITLADWQKLTQTDADSVRLDPLTYDPSWWRLLPTSPGYQAGPGGKDLGADVTRIATTSATKAAVADPDRRAAEWVLSIGGTVQVNGRKGSLAAVADLPQEPFELTKAFLSKKLINDAGLANFKGCTHLVELFLEETEVSDAGLAYFKDCKNLQILHLKSTPIGGAGLSHFKDCKNLKELHLNHSQVGDAALENLQDCKNLTHLNLGKTKVTNAGLAHFKDCKHLVELALDRTKVSNAGLAHFKDCTKLKVLNLYQTEVSDAGLAHFKDCKDLLNLRLAQTRVGDAGLANFKDCKKLSDLSLEQTRVTDAGLAHFKDCTNLAGLHLSFTKVGDAGLAHLKDCKNLTQLFLNDTQVSDASIPHLAGMTKLTLLVIQNTAITKAGYDKLQTLLPKCRIQWKSGIDPKEGE